MKTAMLDAASAAALGTDWLEAAVAPVSPYGERLFARRAPFVPGREAEAQESAERVAAVAQQLDPERLDAVRGVLAASPDVASVVARASLGETLDDPSLLELLRFCEAIERVDALLAAEAIFGPIGSEAVGALAGALAPGKRGPRGFYLAEGFDPALGQARGALAAAQAELESARGRQAERISAELGRDLAGADEFILMRADMPAALPAGVRVVREAATYLLCALELGEKSIAALERRESALARAGAAEESVRERLSALVRTHAAQLDAAAAALGELDVLLSAARFARTYQCAPAQIVSDVGLAFQGGRFLPLAVALEADGRAFTPLDVALHDAVVLTGPNMGGKSVCLQTCGFVALCASYGLPVPAASAQTALFDEIAWLGMGRDAELGGLLSSFAREVVRMQEIFERNAPRLLILVDEFARTTTPHEGTALCIALLERLRERNACGLLATHLGGVASGAGARHFAVRGLRGIAARPPAADLRAALAALAGEMDYTVAEVGADELSGGDAIALAALLGADGRFVNAAYRALSQ